jgi:hypothetical protein
MDERHKCPIGYSWTIMLSMQKQLLAAVSHCQGVAESHLKIVSNLISLEPECVEWASAFMAEKQCFNNALNMSIIDGCDYILGYIWLADFNLAIEHAWNADRGGQFDLTAQLYWNKDVSVSTTYIELLRLDNEATADMFRKYQGVDHLVLRTKSEYDHLFKT